MQTPVFSPKRRDLLAKTLMDLAKILVAAALASEFFGQMPIILRTFLLGLIGIPLATATFICPRRDS